jgi:hypothetical protein
VCESVFGQYSTDGGATWNNFTDTGIGGTPQTCGSLSNVNSYTTTLKSSPGYLWTVDFGYNVGVSGSACGENGYLIAKQVNIAVPDAP